MNQAEKAGQELRDLDVLASRNTPLHRLSPLAKLLFTVLYIAVTVSFHKYDFSGLTVMILFPIIGYQVSLTPVHLCFYKLRVVLPLVCAVGILNPFFDQQVLLTIGSVGISGGVISMITLMMKGVFSLMMSFLLVATTPVEEICRAMRQLHIPKMITSLFLLTFRYISVLLDEVSVMTEAYHLRAPGQKGIHVSAWGSFLGQLLLRSMDRAEALYDSMILRGFHGEFYYAGSQRKVLPSGLAFLICSALVVLCRFYNPIVLIGGLFS